ncbi:MAG: hypothetical protein V1644_01090, partial [Candidatus Micrarchaeota archaeon]
ALMAGGLTKETDIKKVRTKIGATINKLKKRNEIPLTANKDRLRRRKIRTVSEVQVEEHMPYARRIIRRIKSAWAGVLDEDEVEKTARARIQYSLEVHDQTKGAALKTLIWRNITRRIWEVAKKRRKRRKLFSMDAPRSANDERSLHNSIATPEGIEIGTRIDHKRALEALLQSRRAGNHHLVIVALKGIGHTYDEIGSVFKTSRQAVEHHYKDALVIARRKLNA